MLKMKADCERSFRTRGEGLHCGKECNLCTPTTLVIEVKGDLECTALEAGSITMKVNPCMMLDALAKSIKVKAKK
jgi:hypothetical protein